MDEKITLVKEPGDDDSSARTGVASILSLGGGVRGFCPEYWTLPCEKYIQNHTMDLKEYHAAAIIGRYSIVVASYDVHHLVDNNLYLSQAQLIAEINSPICQKPLTSLKMEARKPTIALHKEGLLLKRIRRKVVWGVAPEKFFRATPSKPSEKARLEHGIKLLPSLISVPRKTDPLTWERKAKKPR